MPKATGKKVKGKPAETKLAKSQRRELFMVEALQLLEIDQEYLYKPISPRWRAEMKSIAWNNLLTAVNEISS